MNLEPESKYRYEQNRKFLVFAGALGVVILLSIACMAVYGFYVIPRQAAQRNNQQATLVAQNLKVNQALTARANAPTSTTTPAPFFQYTIDMYGLNLELPMGWIIQEANRRPEPPGIESLAMGHDCADYIVTNPEGSARLTIYPPCEASEGMPIVCPSDMVSIADSGTDKVIGRYFDDGRGAYIYTQAFTGTSSPNGQDALSCYDNPILAIDGAFIRIEFQYVGIDAGKEAMLKLIDQIVLSIKKR